MYLLLGWPFYNSKSSKPKRSASLFGKKNKRLLVSSLKLSIWPMQWLDLVLAKALVKTLHWLSTSLMSPLNKAQELWLIAVAFTLSLSFLLALTAFFSAPHSSRKLFTKPLKQLKEFQPISSNFCVSIINISCAHLLAPLFQLLFPPESPSMSFWKLSFGSRGALKTTPIGLHPGLLSWKVSYRVLPLYKPPALITSSLQRPCCVKRLCNHRSLEESQSFPSFFGWHLK